MTAEIEEVGEADFDRVVSETDKLVAVQFYTEDCPNCRAIAPVYEKLSRELGRDVRFTRVNAQRSIPLATRFGVMGVPTFKFFCKGRPIGELVGAVNETMLRNTMKDLIRHRSECEGRSTPMSWEMDGYG